MSKISFFIKQSWLLLVSSLFFGLLLAVADVAWAPRIEANKIKKLDVLMAALLPDAKTFQLVEHFQIESPSGQTDQIDLYKGVSASGQNTGWAFNASGSGFGGDIELVVAVDSDFKKIAGFKVLESSETPGFGDKIKLPWYSGQFVGSPVGQLQLERTGSPEKIDDRIVAITGATISSQAVVNIINNTLLPLKKQMQQKGLLTGGN
jgi:electron transport complex protein RnfG